MPIVDGLGSTKMIRSMEQLHPERDLAPRASLNGRVPIFAVSASLLERDRQIYIDGGFDGWILKPIDFKRLNTLLEGIVDENTRNKCLYRTGEWEKGGWFRARDIGTGACTPVASLPAVVEHEGKESTGTNGSA